MKLFHAAVALLVLWADVVPAAELEQPLVLTHYMPWYQSKDVSGSWGYHWTMNRFDPDSADPDRADEGRPQLASHFTPLIGAYDSSDPHVLEYHLLTMKLAGIDGVIVDWYGLTDLWDYAPLHRNTTLLIEQCERFGMQFAICYEDKTITNLVKQGRLTESDRVSHAAGEFQWLAENWFSRDGHVKLEGEPVLISFGNEGLTDDEWAAALKQAGTPVRYFSEHTRRPCASGAYDWPLPSDPDGMLKRFRITSRDWPAAIPVAYPRFVDVYKKAGVNDGYPPIPDEGGKTLTATLRQAFAAKPFAIQIATWNDWGEGTQIEPSVEHGYRDVEIIQRRLKAGEPKTLRLPRALLKLRRSFPSETDRLDRAAALAAEGMAVEAQAVTDQLTAETRRQPSAP